MMTTLRTLLTVAALGLLVLPARAQVDRSAPPAPGPAPALELPSVQRFTLSNGLPVVLMEKHQVPLVDLRLLIDAGAVDDPADRRGLASVTLDMMDEGAAGRDALALAEEVDFLGATLRTGSGLHTSVVELYTPLSKLESALPLMADVVLRPDFPEADLERLRLQRLTQLVQAHDEPNAVAATLFDRVLYGAAHPYGASPDEAGLRALSRADLERYHAAAVRPGNATLVVVGDVTRATIEPLLEAAFGTWTGGPSGTPAQVDAVPQVEGRTVYLVDKPGAAQSVIRIGRIGAPRSTDDYYALTVLNTVLGGSFTSRLNQNLREDKGYTYGARSAFDFRPAAGPFLAYAAVQTDVTGPALAEFMKELEAIRTPIPADELERAKNYVALQYPRRFQTVRQVAGELGELVAYDLPESTLTAFTERIQAVTAADVQRVAHQYVDPDHLAIVVVGDRAAVEAQIDALGLGTVELLTVPDVLGPVPVLSPDRRSR